MLFNNCSLTEGNAVCVMWPIMTLPGCPQWGLSASAEPARVPYHIFYSMEHIPESKHGDQQICPTIHWFFFTQQVFIKCLLCTKSFQNSKNWETSCWPFWWRWGTQFKRTRRKLLCTHGVPFSPNFWAGAPSIRLPFPACLFTSSSHSHFSSSLKPPW